MTESELLHYKQTLDLWFKEKKEALAELVAFQTFGARQVQDELRWEPNRPRKQETARPRTGYQCRVCGEFLLKLGYAGMAEHIAKCSATQKAALEVTSTTGGGWGEIQVPRLMKCPTCGTNPGRCEKPLTDEEKVCFSCGRELVSL